MTDSSVHPEIAAILAAGLQRVLQRKSSLISQCEVETPLDCEPEFGGDVDRKSEDIAP
ncbi:hypothetical protein ABIB83_008271 [Bradyrhizobium sp. I1.8.5]|jgi:hypothetical protein|uniref:hypothetical protein n=1 Tax=Bradyrhizobium sp. I1.8.5 TaxID=3156365 RepID=UPI00339A3F44